MSESMPSEREMARVILADTTGQAFEAYYGGIRLASTIEPTREDCRKVLQNVADGNYFDDPTSRAKGD